MLAWKILCLTRLKQPSTKQQMSVFRIADKYVFLDTPAASM